MTENQLLKNIKYEIVKRLIEGDNEGLNVSFILPMSAAEIYPTLNNIEISTENGASPSPGTLKDIIASLKKFCKSKKIRGRLNTYNKEALIRCFQNEWLTTLNLAEKKSMSLNISLIKSLRNNGYVEIKGNDTVWSNISRLGRTESNNYGDCDYVIVNNIHEEETEEPAPREGLSIEDCTSKEKALNSFWVNHIWNNDYSRNMPYVWKLHISKEIYNSLKSLLKSVCNAYCRKKSELLEKHAEKIFVYVAEWYRREFSGRGDNALKMISDNLTAKDIFDNCPKKWRDYVYTSDSYECWLYSIYVLGGLPINYTSNSINSLYDKIFDAINGNTKGLDAEQNFNNTAFKESLRESGGSLNLFVNSIVNDQLPFCESDRELDEVKNFIERINEGHKRNRVNKFRFEWIVNYDGSSGLADRRLRILFNPEIPGDLHEFISYRRLTNAWFISGACNIPNFKILCRINDQEPFVLINFSNQWNGYFQGWMSEKFIDVPREKVPVTYIDNIDILLTYNFNSENCEKIIQSIHYDSYMQFYPTDMMGEWSNMIKSGNRSAVAFRSCLLSENSTDIRFDEGDNDTDIYRWKGFIDGCILTDADNRSINLSRKGDSLEIVPRLKNDVISYNNGNIKYVNESDEKYIPLILGKDGFNVKLYNNNDNSSIDIELSKCHIEYKTPDSTRYKNFDDPLQGLMTIRVTYKEYIAKLMVYYLSSANYNDTIKRDLKQHKITFNKSINNIFNRILTFNGNCFQDIDYSKNTNIYDPLNKYEDTIVFYIGSDDEYIELSVYRPYIRKILSFNGKPIFVSSDKEKVFTISMLHSDRMSVHLIDEKGKTTFPKQNVGFCDFDEDVTWNDVKFGSSIDTENVKYTICDDKEEYGLDKCVITVSQEFRQEYKLFYWQVNGLSDPEEIKTTYDSEKEELSYDKEYISKPGIIFQSLDGLNPPKFWRPVVKLPNGCAEFHNDINTQIKCFDIAIKHEIYFKIFKPLYNLVPLTGGLNDHSMVEFFFEYSKRKNNKLTDKEYHGLYRFADEFMFEWLFLSRSAWIRNAPSTNIAKRRMVSELFRRNYRIKNKSVLEQTAYTQIVDTFWSDSYPTVGDERWKPKSCKLENKAIKFMNSYKDEYDFTGDRRNYNTIKNFIRDLYEKENSFQLIFRNMKDNLLNI